MARIQQQECLRDVSPCFHAGIAIFYINIRIYILHCGNRIFQEKKLSLPTLSQDGKVLFIPSLLTTPFLAARYQSVPSDKVASKVSVGGKAVSDFWRTTKFSFQIGHFRVPLGLCIKMWLSAQPLLWKWFFILMQVKLFVTRKVVHLASIWKWWFLELRSGILSCICLWNVRRI